MEHSSNLTQITAVSTSVSGKMPPLQFFSYMQWELSGSWLCSLWGLLAERSRLLLGLIVINCFVLSAISAEKVYVVERERSRLSVLENNKKQGEIDNLGRLHHATVKFHDGYGYIISRNGYLSQIDLAKDKVVRQVKVGKSSIGFTIGPDFIAVANYDPGDVVILNFQLEIQQRIVTQSRNVGIKTNGKYLIFALMDKDEIWVWRVGKPFQRHHIFRNVGQMPFDALLAGNLYLAGLFKEQTIALVHLDTMKYEKMALETSQGEAMLKIPHFGMWGISGHRAFIPAVGQRRLHVVDLRNFRHLEDIELQGLPVFVSCAPDGKTLAVNFSGDQEDFLTLIDPNKRQVLRHLRCGRRILHLRFSPDSQKIYISSYYQNQVKILDRKTGDLLSKVPVATPSGIFIPNF